MKPVFKIKVFPGKFNPFIREYRHYYHVFVFETKQHMWDAGAKLSSYEQDQYGGYGAVTIPLWRQRYDGDKWIKAPKIGTVLFYKDLLGSECISHKNIAERHGSPLASRQGRKCQRWF